MKYNSSFTALVCLGLFILFHSPSMTSYLNTYKPSCFVPCRYPDCLLPVYPCSPRFPYGPADICEESDTLYPTVPNGAETSISSTSASPLPERWQATGRSLPAEPRGIRAAMESI